MGSQLPVIAKWEHIKELYEGDKLFVIRRLVKLTDIPLAPITRCAMKVSLAAQAMSHTVAAALYVRCLLVRNSVFIHSVFIRNKVTYSKVT